jgi:tetratricopeptide (TPR) repeat protein
MRYLTGRLSTDLDQRHGAMGLATELGCQPLALAQASATIATSIVSCADYQDRFNRRRARLAGPGGGRAAVGEVTWRLSAEQAERLAPGGAPRLLLALAALLAGDAIPAATFIAPATCGYLAAAGAPAGADPGKAWAAVLALERTGLLVIGADGEPAVVRMSPAVTAQVQAATPGELSGQAMVAAADALLEAWPEDPQPWLSSSLRSCAASLQHTAGDRLWAGGEVHPLLLRAGQSMDGARLTGPAASYWARLTATSDRIHGPDSPVTVTIGSHLARALLAAGHNSEAVTWSKWVVTRQTRAHGPGHPATLAARITHGRALTAAGRPGQAVTVLGEATGEYERTHGPGHPGTIEARDELAAACQAAGRADEAIGHYQRALADRDQLLGPRHSDTITARENLAGAYLSQARFDQALAHYKGALADREDAFGPDHQGTIAARASLAGAYHAAGKMAAALTTSEQACADHERVLGADHPGTLARHADLARAYQAAGRLADAATLLRDTLARCEQTLPPEHPLTQAVREAMTGAGR